MNDGVNCTAAGTPSPSIAAFTGAPVSGSQTKTFASGATARSALATPVVSPPPPHGMSTVSKSSSCSASSSPIVPFPAMTASSRTGWTKKPSMSSAASFGEPDSTAAHHASQGTRTIRPPMRSTAASFDWDALSGTTIVAATPS
jgi:hypothetical protein